MFSFLNFVSDSDKAVITHLEERLRSGANLSEAVTLRIDETVPDRVVLATHRRGMAPVSQSFSSALVRIPARLRELDQELDIFVAAWP